MEVSKVDATDAPFLTQRKKTCPTVSVSYVSKVPGFISYGSKFDGQNFLDSGIEFDSMMHSQLESKSVSSQGRERIEPQKKLKQPEVLLSPAEEIRKTVREIKDQSLSQANADRPIGSTARLYKKVFGAKSPNKPIKKSALSLRND